MKVTSIALGIAALGSVDAKKVGEREREINKENIDQF